MQNFWLHNLIYKFHRIGFYIRSVQYYYQDNYKKQNKILCLFRGLFRGLKIFNYKYGYYEYLEIPITNKCSLMCKHCSNLIPCYTKRSDYDEAIILKSIKKFLECIEQIVYIRVLGGEPFLSKNLYNVNKVLLKSDKIQRIEIVTNGTIIPKEKRLIRQLRNPKIIVCISEYPMVKSEELIAFLNNNSIKYRIDKMNFWMDYGKPYKRNKSIKELKKQFNRCHYVCKSLVNGEFHLCPRSSHGTDLGIIKDNEDDYLNLLDDSLSTLEKKKRLRKLLKKKYIIACDYCIYGTRESKKVPVAEQLRKK